MLLVVLAALCALLLVLPGETVTTRYLSDPVVTLNGAYRDSSGQMPGRDFHTPFGPLAYYAPAAGFALSGTLGGAIPVATTLTPLVLAVSPAFILHSRLRPVLANPFSAGLSLPPSLAGKAWMHWEQNINAERFPSPEHLFGGVEILMEPRWGINSAPLRGLNGDCIRMAFGPVREMDFWIVQRRRAHSIAPGTSASGVPAQMLRIESATLS
jgi:hypothetical protein